MWSPSLGNEGNCIGSGFPSFGEIQQEGFLGEPFGCRLREPGVHPGQRGYLPWCPCHLLAGRDDEKNVSS